MRSGTVFEQGGILIVPFPFSDLSGIKQRPVLVLSNNKYNEKSRDIITCGITSNLQDLGHSIVIDKVSLEHGTIPAKSMVKVDKIFALEKSIVRKNIAKIKPEVFSKVKSELLKLFDN